MLTNIYWDSEEYLNCSEKSLQIQKCIAEGDLPNHTHLPGEAGNQIQTCWDVSLLAPLMASKQYKGERQKKNSEGFSFLWLGYFISLPLFIDTFLILEESDHL